MRNASAFWACIRYDLRKLLGSQRFYLAVLLVLFVIRDYLLPCKEWFVALSCNITPWIFPHVTDDLFIQMTIMCGLIFVLNDAPFLDDMQLFIIVRSGRGTWCLGQLLYILLGSLLYVLCIAAGCAALMLPHLEWSLSWGRVIATLATGQVALPTYFEFSCNIYKAFSPLTAMGMSTLYCWLGCCCLGMLIFFVNLSGTRVWGSVAAGALVLQDLFSMMLLPEGAEYFSVVSLTRFSVFAFKRPYAQIDGMHYALSVLTAFVLLFALLSLWRTRKMSVSTSPAI